MGECVKSIIVCLNFLRFFPHLCIARIVGGVINEDVKVNCKHKALNYSSKCYGLLYLLTFDKLFRVLFYYRLGHLKYLVMWLAPPHNSFVIGNDTIIGKGMLCVHPIGTVVNAKSIGEHFIVGNNTVIGANVNGVPIIGDNVFVGVNSVIIGNITIGNNVKIGAGSIVVKDVPSNCTIVGNPARIIKHNNN